MQAMAILRQAALVGAVVLAAAQPTPGRAAEGYQFSISTSASSPDSWVKCNGPWGRVSRCERVRQGAQGLEFYLAERNVFSLLGEWQCRVYSNDSCHVLDVEGFKQFCIPSADSTSTGWVQLDYDKSRSYHERLKVDIVMKYTFPAPDKC